MFATFRRRKSPGPREQPTWPSLEDPPGYYYGHKLDTEPLPPFTGDDAQCPKCRCIGASLKYEAGSKRNDRLGCSFGCQRDSNTSLSLFIDRFHRKCNICGFYWHEAVPDEHS